MRVMLMHIIVCRPPSLRQKDADFHSDLAPTTREYYLGWLAKEAHLAGAVMILLLRNHFVCPASLAVC